MRNIFNLLFLLFTCAIFAQTRYHVSSQKTFDSALEKANSGDSIIWKAGLYNDVFMKIEKDELTITAEKLGKVTFSGSSKVEIHADKVEVSGFQYIGGDIGTDDIISIWGSDVLITQLNLKDYTSHKYLIIDEDSRRTTISHCNFENRILSLIHI